MMDYEHVFRGAVAQIRGEGRYRVFCDLERRAGAFPHARRYPSPDALPHPVTVWCSNDYLGMGQHPVVLEAAQVAVRTMGAGAGGTRNISGTTHLHVLLERELAALHAKPAALVFTSGFVANEATLSTIGQLLPGCVIYSDASNHASMIAGIRHSGCAKRIFRHNDVGHLEALLAESDPSVPKLIAFESVYSMDGDFGRVAEICEVAERYGAMTYLDEVHAVRHVRAHGELRERHQERAATLKRRLLDAGLPVMPSPSHIVPVLVGDPVLCKRASDLLLDQFGVYLQPINYPTVARGTERLRITPSPHHDDATMDHLIDALSAIWSRLQLDKAA
jgi:7-keto-8-aminopelargonate synthetase-like enzyme